MYSVGHAVCLPRNGADLVVTDVASAAGADLVSVVVRVCHKLNTNEARRDALVAKAGADYAVTKEGCDALAGSAKDGCMNAAKANFGKM